ncbi:MAG: valine--tRNA ligase [Pseudomonadota bacterium]
MLDKTYAPADIEARIADLWDKSGAFQAGRPERSNAEPYTIVIPPPNVTGSLHMGHALNNTLQDVLCRFERMRGRDVLWQPGTDHAGIATQMVVERLLAERGEPDRRALGRDAFLKKVWEWKEESGGTITTQLRRLGASCDWSRERFTMDEGLSRAVLEVFVRLYEDGLIYRGKRLVNWDPKFETAISDLEVENVEVDGNMWHFKYPLADGETYEYVEKDADGNVTLTETRDYISIATTRPETMLGDGAVAVHPRDERYAPIVGKLCEIPVGPKEHRRLIPIVTDEYPDPDFGSGAVKITGAHDFNDYAVAKRCDIPLYRLMDTSAALRADGPDYATCAEKAADIVRSGTVPDEATVDAINLVPDEYRGMDRYAAREKIVADINADGLAVMTTDAEGNAVPFVEDKKIMQPFGDRSNVVIEPMLTDQWFCDAKTLAEPAIHAVRSSETTFVPEAWSKTYFQWMENIEPWCISRQLWWGHRIPVWYGPSLDANGRADHTPGREAMFVAKDEAGALKQAKTYYAKHKGVGALSIVETADAARGAGPDRIALWRDPDVLDTWFSSALWPFSTLGWPDDSPVLDKHYKTDVLVTGFDIIFFWVARMMMMGMHFMKDETSKPEVPFHTVYIHALVRDEKGQKMSKSKGNVMDPLDLIDGISLQGLVDKRTRGMMNPQDAKKIERQTRADYPDGLDGFGADALRFTLAAMAAQGRDVRLSVERIKGYRNFATKLWNAARFAEMNECVRAGGFDPTAAKQTVNIWIRGEVEETARLVTAAIEAYKFNEAAGAVYEFTWGTFCDWYLELIKPILNGSDAAAVAETRAMVAWTLDEILKLLHPFMPFITEELWARTAEYGPGRETPLVLAPWPSHQDFVEPNAAAEIGWVTRLIGEIRSVRSEMNVPAGAKMSLTVIGADPTTRERLRKHDETIKRLARLDGFRFEKAAPEGSAAIIVDEVEAALPLAGIIDMDAERARLGKEIEKARDEIAKIDAKLANPKFVERAPEDVVEENRERRVDFEGQITRLEAALRQIAA